jgi:hypothetical protein
LIRHFIHLTGLVLLVSLMACLSGEKSATPEDKLLAQVHNRMLYQSHLAGMFPENCTAEDSSKIVTNFIERWVRDNVLMHEAERNLPKDLNIDELVRDYRSSLIRHNFEKTMVNFLLDTIVSNEEKKAYYEKNKEHFSLPTTILRCHLIKVPKNVAGFDALKKLWRGKSDESFTGLLEFATKHASVYMLEDSTWYKIEDIALQLPKGSINSGNLSEGKDILMEDHESHYFFRVLEIIGQNKLAPTSYVDDQISKVILHERKEKLIQEKKEEMYQRELRKNNIKVFN